MDEEKSLLDSTHDDILKSPAESTKSDSPEIPSVPVKRVSLKRNVSVTIPIIASSKPEEKPIEEKEEEPSAGEPDKKIIKISVLTPQDRLELRAKKFGNSSTTSTLSSSAIDEKKEARAARFGLVSSSDTTAATTKPTQITAAPSASLDILKKRAERFGSAISSTLKTTEQEEKLLKRQERFGTTSVITINSKTDVDYAEKARLRAERFNKTAV